jgi:CheY-like chemotaxis protein
MRIDYPLKSGLLEPIFLAHPAPRENMPPKSTTSAACETTRGYLHDCTVTGTHRNGIRVLVVDDQASIRLPLCDDLDEAGFTVSAAANVADALGTARAHRPHVVVLDILLGAESGLEVARALRNDPGDIQPLIIALSGHTGSRFVRGAGEAGCDFYLTKTSSRTELIAAIDGLLGLSMASSHP